MAGRHERATPGALPAGNPDSLAAGAKAFVGAFLLGNLSYLWIVKDAQYEARAAPSAALIEELKSRPPVCLAVAGFPENPWIGRLTTRLLPGWRPELLIFEGLPTECQPVAAVRWNARRLAYQEVPQPR